MIIYINENHCFIAVHIFCIEQDGSKFLLRVSQLIRLSGKCPDSKLHI